MSMVKADEAIAELTIDINDKQKVLEAVIHLQKMYPDLKVQREIKTTSLSSIKFSTSAVNSVTDNVDIVNQSDFKLSDSPLSSVSFPIDEFVHAWPYTTIDGYKVYSDPPSFEIGQMHRFGFGVNPAGGWEDTMEEAGINKGGIRAARNHLKKNPPISYHLTNTQDTDTP